MKKFIATIMMVVILTLSLGMAHAEGLCCDIRAWRIGTDEAGKVTYYVTYATEDEVLNEFPVSQSVFETAVSVLHDRKMEEERQERIREYQADRGSWIKDVAAWCSFWNPND